MPYMFPSQQINRGDVFSCHFKPPLLAEDYALPLCLESMGIRYPQEPVHYKGVHYSFFNFCTEGRGKLFLEGKTYDILPGTGFIVTSNTPVEYYATEEKLTTYWISVAGYLKNEIFEYKNILFELHDMDILLEKFYDLITMPIDIDWRTKSSTLVYEYMLILNKQIRRIMHPEDKYTSLLDPATSYLTYNISQPYDSQKLAKLLDITPTHMCRLFKIAYNCTPQEFAEKLKMDYARRILEIEKKLSMSEISKYCGYENVSYFTSLFKKHFGTPPATYRRTFFQNDTL